MDSGQSIADRAYASIRADILAGVYRPGERLDAAIIARNHHASITPIREALNRLVGEGLIEMQPHQGFRVPLPTAAELAALYDWICQLLVSALRLAPIARISRFEEGLWPGAQEFEANWVEATERICLGIAQLSGNTRCYQAIDLANSQIRAMRRAEHLVVENDGDELRGFPWTLKKAGRESAEAALIAYHRKRADAAPAIIGLLTMAANNGLPVDERRAGIS